MPVFAPTREQIHRATYSHERWRLSHFRGNHYTPLQWAITMLQDEWLNRRELAKW